MRLPLLGTVSGCWFATTLTTTGALASPQLQVWNYAHAVLETAAPSRRPGDPANIRLSEEIRRGPAHHLDDHSRSRRRSDRASCRARPTAHGLYRNRSSRHSRRVRRRHIGQRRVPATPVRHPPTDQACVPGRTGRRSAATGDLQTGHLADPDSVGLPAGNRLAISPHLSGYG